jgi:hypothetical protein
MDKNIIKADIIKYIHIFLIIYVYTGWLITPVKYLHYYIFLIIFIFLDWNDLDGQCILTRLEFYFRTGDWTPQETPEFFRPIINKMFGLKLIKEEGNRLNYFSFTLCLLLGFFRFQREVLSYKN